MSDSTVNQRDARGEWRPPYPVVLAPINAWPPQPAKVLKWLLNWPGYIWPENACYLIVSIVTWIFLTPELAAMKSFELWWIALLLVRNAAIIGLFFGGMHYLLYIRKKQGDNLRYTTRPFPTNNKRFKFGNQVRDNVFHTMISAVPIITAYEAITYWLFANGYIGLFDLSSPIAFWAWFVALLLLGPVIHSLHFYLGHRLLHVPFMYKRFHALHHNNVQVGPWSGLSMHPVEHVIYFSTVVVQWLLALHPLNVLFQLHLAGLLPAASHSGYEKVGIFKGVDLAAGSHLHYQHHKHFECNYGGSLIPLDQWYGTFHDGTIEADRALRDRIKRARAAHHVDSFGG